MKKGVNTKEKKFPGGAPENKKKEYAVISRTSQGGGKWELVYDSWTGCQCTKIRHEIEIYSESMPGKKELILMGAP